MTRTHEKVSPLPDVQRPGSELPAPPLARAERPTYDAQSATDGVVSAIKLIDGRWKLVILFHLFGGQVKRFSDLERAIPAVSQKMLAQQLRQMETDGLVQRVVYPTVPPKVEYSLTDWGQSLCPALDSLLMWIEARQETQEEAAAAISGEGD